MKLTYGRYPTYEEIKHYYARDDILQFINDAASVRKVVLTFREEPSIHNEGESPELEPMNADRLREYVAGEIANALPEDKYPSERQLQAYPSLHFITKGPEGWCGCPADAG